MPASAKGVAFDGLLKVVSERLKPLGFRRGGSTFRKIVDGNAMLIYLQRSRDLVEGTKFTVNLAVVCGALLQDGWEPELAKAGEVYGHLRTRIGSLMPEKSDLWWTLGAFDSDDAPTVSLVTTAIVDLGVPYLERYVRSNDLIELWKSGAAPGLTEFQRTKYLAALQLAQGVI